MEGMKKTFEIGDKVRFRTWDALDGNIDDPCIITEVCEYGYVASTVDGLRLLIDKDTEDMFFKEV